MDLLRSGEEHSACKALHCALCFFGRPKNVSDCFAVLEEFLQPLFFTLFLSRGCQHVCVLQVPLHKGDEAGMHPPPPPHIRNHLQGTPGAFVEQSLRPDLPLCVPVHACVRACVCLLVLVPLTKYMCVHNNCRQWLR